jgi:hypothetical protein
MSTRARVLASLAMRASKICLFSVIALAACGPPSRGGIDGAGGGGGGGGGGDGGNESGCSAEAKLVYTIDQFTNKLARFDPATKTFTDIGALSCPTMAGATPFSMGVDRMATAYVLYNSGELFRVDTTTLACAKTSWAGSNGLHVFGMGFSTDTPGGTTDTLFVGGGANQMQSTYTLAKIDVGTMTSTVVGNEPQLPEMTGTGSAQLWGFFPAAASSNIIRIDKTNGSAAQTFNETTLGAAADAGYAFAFWGGDFWVFLIRSGEPETKVYQVDGMSGAIKGTTSSGGRTIVGAGVSTCAPVVVQ